MKRCNSGIVNNKEKSQAPHKSKDAWESNKQIISCIKYLQKKILDSCNNRNQ